MRWVLDEAGTLTIYGTGWMDDYFSVWYIPPWKEYAYADATWEDNVIPIKFLYIKEGVISIGNYAFYDCYHLVGASIPATVTDIGESAFSSCGMDFVFFKGDAPSIAHDAFDGTSTICYYPEGNMTWTDDVMQNYGGSITWIPLDNGIIDMGTCGEDLVWTLDDAGTLTISGIGVIDGKQWDSNRSSVKTVLIQDGVTSIGDYAFSRCDNLTGITIPDSVTSIGDYAFSCCDNLTGISIPASVTSIGTGAFEAYGGNLTGIWVDADNPTYCNDGRGVLFNKDKTCLIQAPGALSGSYIIPDGVTSIGNYAFNSCVKLTGITIPDSVTSIGDHAFSYCNNITNITIPDGVTSIRCATFFECDNLASIAIPESVTSIGDSAFKYCSKLTDITIPDDVTMIGSDAFYGCSSLNTITIPCGVTSIARWTFVGCKGLGTITIPDTVTSIEWNAFSGCESLADVYYGGTEDQKNKISIKSGNTSLTSAAWHCQLGFIANGTCGDNLTWTLDDAGTLTVSGTGDMANYSYNGAPWYSNRSSIKTVSIQDGVTSIGDYAFYDCSSLASITILDSVTSIGAGAFVGCSKLTDIDIPNSVVHIGEDAFFYCERLTSVTLPDGITSISAGLFSNCGNLVSVGIPENVTSIGDCAFGECWSLQSVDIPASVTNIGTQAFWYCESLTSVMLPNGITEIADGLFSCCSNLVTVNIPKGVTCIGYGAFRGCAITSIEIPNSVTSIADEAFFYCPSLTSITIPASVTSVGEYAFGSCYSLSSVAIPNNLTNIAEGTFYECDSLTDVYYNGTAEQWASVSIGEENDALLDANIIYLGDSNFSVVTPNKEKHYLSLEGAIANAAGGYVCLYGNVTGNVSVSADTYLDLNGHTLTGDISIADGATLYVFDSATSDYTAENRGKIVGTITGDLARTMNTPKDSYGHNYKYLTLKESDGSYSFHRYYLTVKSVVLVPYMKGEGYIGTAVDYKTVFKCNDVMAQYVTAYGTKLVGDNTVYANYMAKGYSLLTGADNTNEQRTWLSGTFKSTNTAEQNAANALLAPAVSAYIMLNDGLAEEVTSAGVQRSLQDMIVYANGLDDLTTTEKAALGKMYNLFKDVLDTWTEVDITNIKRYAAELA